MVAYKERHGHLKITCNADPPTLKLREWMRRQRKDRYKLRPYRLKKLNSFGFEWHFDAGAVWDGYVAMYAAFVEDFGVHCIPEKASVLSNWIRRQRLSYREGRLRDDRIDKLNEIGFPWGAVGFHDRTKPSFFPEFAQANGQGNPENPDEFLLQIWNSRYKALAEHKKRVGNCLVSDNVDCSLQKWCAKQRLLHSTGALIASRATMLEALDFDFRIDSAPSKSEAWESMYRQLESFQEQNGHCIVPPRTRQHRSLNCWVKMQRQEALTMDPSMRAKLDKLGFCWTVDDDNDVTMTIASQTSTECGNTPTKLEEPERKVLHAIVRSRTRRSSRQQSVRADAPTLRHVLMSDMTLVNNAINKPVSSKGCDALNMPVGIKFDDVDAKSAGTDAKPSSESLEPGEHLDVVSSDEAASFKAKCAELESMVETYRNRLSVVEKELKATNSKLRQKEIECRKMSVVIAQMKNGEFASGSVGDKVISRLRAKMSQKGKFPS